jgi:hypothetical protein
MRALVLLISLLVNIFLWSQEKIYAPTLVSPSDGATNIHPSILLDWNPVATAAKYQIWIDTTASFSNPASYFVTYSAYMVNLLLFNTTYYWKVRAIGVNNDTSSWSAVRSFTTIEKPTLKYPSSGSKPTHAVHALKWDAINGASGYVYEVDTTATFSSPLLVQGVSTTNSATVALLRYGQTYYWRVKAFHSLDTSNWSNTNNYVTKDSVPIISPVNGSTTVTPVNACKVKSILGTRKYEFWVDSNSNFATPFVFYWDSTKISTNTGDTIASYYLDTIPFGTLYMKFRCISKYDTSKWSNVISFKTLDAIQLVSPSQNATNVPCNTTFQWKRMPGCVKYVLEYDTLPDFSTKVSVQRTDSFYTLSASSYLKKLTTYYWRVFGITNTATTPNFNSWKFTTGYGVGINDNPLSQIQVYPNPATDVLYIKTAGENITDLFIKDILGNVVKTIYPTLQQPILKLDLSDLPKGVYVLDVRMGNKFYQQKFIKN